MTFRQVFFLPWLFLLLVALTAAGPSNKVESPLAATLTSKNIANIFVKFQGGISELLKTANFSQNDRSERTIDLVSHLKLLSQNAQRNALSFLRTRSPFSVVTQLWISNELYVKGATAQVVAHLATLPEVEEIREERIVPLEFNVVEEETNSQEAQWNLEIIEATTAWQIPGGNNGMGVVVANVDSGVRHTHEALRNNYRANYGWYDPLRDYDIPHDASGHGSHTMGSMAGAQIGVAPGVQWISCRACGAVCSEEALKLCGEWILCPFLPDHSAPDCSKAPHVVSNSWGGGSESWYQDVITAWKVADIIPVFSNGNSGPACQTVGHPANADVIAVGSTTSNDTLSTSSSAGPAADGTIKPDITAPGHLIRSATKTNDTAYIVASGSSMAAPHIGGVVAILLSQNPTLKYAQVKQLIEDNADRGLPETGRICGGIPSTQFPNNQYGHGRVNARKALAAAISGYYEQ